jgi:hypothetical protein
VVVIERNDGPAVSSPGSATCPPALSDLAALEAKINVLLPPQYHSCYDDVSTTSMGSAALRYDPDGKVAWDEIWTSFCGLALAGGPAHRGTLLEAVPVEEVLAEPEAYRKVATEIGRGIWMVTRLPVVVCVEPGWVSVRCRSEAMVSWLAQAIVAENLTVRREPSALYLPAGPRFRLEKEIKNVVTTVAKTVHYWDYHMPAAMRMPGGMAPPLLEPALPAAAGATPDAYRAAVAATARGIQERTGLPIAAGRAAGWVGVRCADAEMAAWLLRAVAVEQVLVRREEEVLCLPVNPNVAGSAERVAAVVGQAHRLWELHVARRSAP